MSRNTNEFPALHYSLHGFSFAAYIPYVQSSFLDYFDSIGLERQRGAIYTMDEASYAASGGRGRASQSVFDVSTMQFISDDDADAMADADSGREPADEEALQPEVVTPACPAETQDSGPFEESTIPAWNGVALQSDVLQQLHRQPSAALGDDQLAVYLQFRGVDLAAVVEWGIYYYMSQHEHGYDETRRELTQQIHTTVADMDHFGVLVFFRSMLEHEHLEAFYQAVYQLVLDRINTAVRVSFFADVIHPLPHEAHDEDAITPTEPDADSSAESGRETDTDEQ